MQIKDIIVEDNVDNTDISKMTDYIRAIKAGGGDVPGQLASKAIAIYSRDPLIEPDEAMSIAKQQFYHKKDSQTDVKQRQPNTGKLAMDPTEEPRKRGAQLGNQNAYKGGPQGAIPGLKDLPKIDTSTVGKSATSSFAFGQAAADIAGNKIGYSPKKGLALAASKKNPNNKL